MNARDRIIEALAEAEAQPVINIPDLADAVLAVLPGLLTDPDIVDAAKIAIHHYDMNEGISTFPISNNYHKAEAQAALTAAAQALIGEAP